MLDIGSPNVGFMSKGELINFQFSIFSSNDTVLNVELVNPEGNAELYVKKCKDYDCTISMKDIKIRDKI